MPRDFFKGHESDLRMHYEFLRTEDINNRIWDYQHIDEFCRARKELMVKELQRLYGIGVSPSKVLAAAERDDQQHSTRNE